MSGFAGIIRLEPRSESAERDHENIAHMARAIAFRCPDALRKHFRVELRLRSRY